MLLTRFEALVVQKVDEEKPIPVTKEFYKAYQFNENDKFHLNEEIIKIILADFNKDEFISWFNVELEKKVKAIK